MVAEQGEPHIVDEASRGFHEALIRAHRMHGQYDELEAAASQFCQMLRSQGVTPEGVVVHAKRVIADAIDDHDRGVAERAVTMCIRHYYDT